MLLRSFDLENPAKNRSPPLSKNILGEVSWFHDTSAALNKSTNAHWFASYKKVEQRQVLCICAKSLHERQLQKPKKSWNYEQKLLGTC